MLKRVESGIIGLDEVLHGGFPESSVIYVAGEAGTGKTTFAAQFLFHGAKKGEKGLYVTGISEAVSSIKRFMSNYSFYDEKVITDGILKFWDLANVITPDFPERGLKNIDAVVRDAQPKRVVIDPLPASYLFNSVLDYRRFLYKLFGTLKNLNTTVLAVGEKSSASGIESYMADSVIHLSLKPLENPLQYRNLLQVKKMRGTSHTKELLALETTEDGLRIFKVGRIL